MARAPLIQLCDISLTFGPIPVFNNLNLAIKSGDRIALVGRNGCGKSTLMKVIAGYVEADRGKRTLLPHTNVGYMEQDPSMKGFTTLGDYAVSALQPGQDYLVERASQGLKLDPNLPVSTASGGERRRAALAKLIAEAPDLMLLDEPTNHLDIEAIVWLENLLKNAKAGFVLISHDRTFLSALTRATLWIDRGQVLRNEKGFNSFDKWRDKLWEEEDTQRQKMDRHIKSEERWAVEGISARRKRNQGRLKALKNLKLAQASKIDRSGIAAMELASGTKSGRKVIEVIKINKTFGETTIIKDFSITINRGDRVAVVGPNGVGKTTLINLLIGRDLPDKGEVKHGTNLVSAIFDQSRSQLLLDLSLWENLTADPGLGVVGKVDQILVRGRPKHVIGYLKEFLFEEGQARASVRSLSGGEKARLLLAKLMARESNLLVLDEPTNDLDTETLDLLQELLEKYDGTVLLVSHDRDFIDRVAKTTIAMERGGKAIIYAGGWRDYQSSKKLKEVGSNKLTKKAFPLTKPKLKKEKSGLNFSEKHKLKEVMKLIEKLQSEKEMLEAYLSDPNLYLQQPLKYQKAIEALAARTSALNAAEQDWLELEERSSE